MVLTVRQCLNIDAWKEVKVVAGERGLENPVSFVNIMEVPEVVRWMKGGELLLTSGYAFKDDPLLQQELIRDLKKKRVSGLGIKPGQYLSEVPPVLIEHANQLDFPILVLPPDMPYMELMLPVFEILISYQLYQLKKAEEIHNRLLEVILKDNGFKGLCQSLSELVGNPVLIVDKAGACLAGCPETGFAGDYSVTELLESLVQSQMRFAGLNANRWYPAELELGEKSQPLVVVPISLDDGIIGFLLAVECNKKIDQHDARAMEYAGTIAALIFAKEKAVFEAERQIKGELLDDLLTGNFQSEEVIIRRASFLNFNVKKPLSVFILDIDGFERYFIEVAGKDESRAQAVKRDILQLCHNVFFDYPGGVMLHMKSDGIVGLVPVTGSQEERLLRQKCRHIAEQVRAKHPKVTVSIGVGRVYAGIGNIKKSHQEAAVALKVGRHLHGGGCVSFFNDLGPYRFLYELQDSPSLAMFQNDYVEKIKLYDAQNNTALYDTLVCYFKNDCNFKLTIDNQEAGGRCLGRRAKTGMGVFRGAESFGGSDFYHCFRG